MKIEISPSRTQVRRATKKSEITHLITENMPAMTSQLVVQRKIPNEHTFRHTSKNCAKKVRRELKQRFRLTFVYNRRFVEKTSKWCMYIWNFGEIVGARSVRCPVWLHQRICCGVQCRFMELVSKCFYFRRFKKRTSPQGRFLPKFHCHSGSKN